MPEMTDIDWTKVSLHDDHTYMWMETQEFCSPRVYRSGAIVQIMNWLIQDHGFPRGLSEFMLIRLYNRAVRNTP